MADIANIESKLTDVEIGFNQPVSEQLNTRVGGNINNLIDENNAQDATITALDTRVGTLETNINGGVFIKTPMTLAGPNPTSGFNYTVPAGKYFIGSVRIDSSGGGSFSLTVGNLVGSTFDPIITDGAPMVYSTIQFMALPSELINISIGPHFASSATMIGLLYNV
jgi:hypothetical protein